MLTLFHFMENSQFGDIYQEDHFLTIMKDEIHIVKELPPHLKSVNIEAIGAQVCQILIFLLTFALHVSEHCLNNIYRYIFARLLMLTFQKKQAWPITWKEYFQSCCRRELFTFLDLEIGLVLIHCLLIFR